MGPLVGDTDPETVGDSDTEIDTVGCDELVDDSELDLVVVTELVDD